jgi:hypothetical protein
MAEVVSIIRNPSKAQSIVDRAFHEVALSPAWTFRQMVERFDKVVDDEAQRIGLSRNIPLEALGPLELAISTRGLELVSRGRYLEEHVLPVYNKLVEDYQKLANLSLAPFAYRRLRQTLGSVKRRLISPAHDVRSVGHGRKR